MNHFSKKENLFVPDGTAIEQALSRTTTLCISAHQDDIEFMAYSAIADCFKQPDKWFSACVATDGAGSPRSGVYAQVTDKDMKEIRIQEQNKAAAIGEYTVQVQLGYSSAEVKADPPRAVTDSLATLLEHCRPTTVLTHNLADKHDTHVAVALHVIRAIRSLPKSARPRQLFGMEVWRGLDWLPDAEKTVFDASTHPNLAAALMGVYDSQISGGKRYDTAVLGRRAANATFYESHGTDTMTQAIYAMDMSALINSNIQPRALASEKIDSFKNEVLARLGKFE